MFTPNIEQLTSIYAQRREDARAFSSLGEKNFVEGIGPRIKAFAKAAFGTQTALAEDLGMSTGQLSDYVSGRKSPGAEFLARLRERGASVDWILSGKGEMLLPSEEDIEAQADAAREHSRKAGPMVEFGPNVEGIELRFPDGTTQTYIIDPNRDKRIEEEEAKRKEEE